MTAINFSKGAYFMETLAAAWVVGIRVFSGF